MTQAGPFLPDLTEVRNADGTPIAIFEVTSPDGARTDRPPLLLVHGATADHTTWRAVGPRFAATRRVFAMDRRGRGASGDRGEYTIEMEYVDVAAAARGVAAATGTDLVDVAGHSYGGRCALGASLLEPAIRKVVVGGHYVTAGLAERLAASISGGGAMPHESLTDREYQVFRLMAVGQSSRQIATSLSLSIKTVSTHRAHIFEKMQMTSAAQIAAYAVRNRLTD